MNIIILELESDREVEGGEKRYTGCMESDSKSKMFIIEQDS